MIRLIKDIVTEDEESFDIHRFLPLLQERIYVINPYCRQFIIAWIVLLSSLKKVDLVIYLPSFLDGLFNMLKDTNKDIRLEADTCLAEFLQKIKERASTIKNTINIKNIVAILLSHCESKGFIIFFFKKKILTINIR